MPQTHKSKAVLIFFIFNMLTFLLIAMSTHQLTVFADNGLNGDGSITPEIPEVDAETLKGLNPLQLMGSRGEEFLPGGDFSPAAFINAALNIIFPLAGLILFLMIVWGGFEMLTGVAGKKGLEAGKQRVTAAVIGFLLLFASYWIIQIIETITGVTILG